MTAPGFNVIGYASGNLGLGVHARSVIDTLLARDFRVAVLDLDPGFGRQGFEPRHQDLFVASAEALPHAINCFILPPPSLGDAAERFAALLSRPGALNAVFCMWELPQVAEAWHPAMRMFDVLAAGSPFIRQSLEFSLPNAEIIDAPLFLPKRSSPVPQRRRFGLDDESCYCIASFEPFSSMRRKNIKAVVAAFEAAAAAAPNLKLIIKVNNAAPGGVEHPDLILLRQSLADIRGVRLMTDTLSHPELLSLFASCDIYISLHRAEGFGLGMYEAMQLGKPVVATGWSGNMGFMNRTNACLASYRLVPVKWGGAAYSSFGYGTPVCWAKANVDNAAKWLVTLAGSPQLRREKGAAAAAAIAAYEQRAARGDVLDELHALHRQKQLLGPGASLSGRKSLVRRVLRKAQKIFGQASSRRSR